MKKKRFGQPQQSIKEAKKFILSFQDCVIKNDGDKVKAEHFLQANSDKLDESLIKVLPLVFRDLTTNKFLDERVEIAKLFAYFGIILINSSLFLNKLNIELSITVFKLALKILNYQDYPESWAGLQHGIGIAYNKRIKGERAANLETAIDFYQESLKIFTVDAFPEAWAMAQMNLGSAYLERIRGERTENLETAIDFYQEAFKIYNFDIFSQDWAMAQMNLGNAYLTRIRGDRAENLETAIICYQEAFKVFTVDAFPQDWAKTQMNLGNAYLTRIRGERAENLELAITCYQEAFKVYTVDTFPQDWAKTQMNLGNAYLTRIRGERAENLELAITCCQNALKIYTFNTFPQDWAMAHINLGNVYLERIRGERADNLETAINYYQNAFKVYTVDTFPQNWAITQGNWTEVLIERASLTNNSQDLDQAIELCRQSLTISAHGSSYFINQQYNLGKALARRYENSKNPDDLQQSLAAYKIALNYLSPEHYDHQEYWQAIPATQAILGSRFVRDGRWQEGLQLLINSLNQLKTGGSSLVYANTLYETGYAYEILSDWENARLYYRDALRLYEHLNDLRGIAKSREGLGGVFVSQGYLDKGMLELAKSRELYQQLDKTESLDRIDHLYQIVQQAKEKQKEVLV